MSQPPAETETFGAEWWDNFAARWNGVNGRLSLSSTVVFVLQVIGVACMRCEFREDGLCSLSEVRGKEDVPTFSGTVEIWRSVLTGLLGVEKAVLSGDIEYVGPTSFLAENWDLLRAVVANGAQLVDMPAAVPVVTLTDVMLHTKHSTEIIAILREYVGMEINANEGSWTGLVHPVTLQRVVITNEALPLGPSALGCQVQDIDAVLAALTAVVPLNSLRISRANGYAHVLLYESLSLLLYLGN